MKSSIISVVALLLAGADAFPFIGDPSHPLTKLAAAEGSQMLEEREIGFNEKEQHVPVSGKHRFIPPKESDTRGPCPGLNAMANHNYLPRNGRGTIEQFSQACQTVYNMAPSLAIFLSTFGAVLDGNLLSWSVGGKPHTGISGAHSNYESDSSIMRGDLHQYGNSDALRMKQFMTLYNLQPDAKTASYDRDVMSKFRRIRFDQSISGNPLFFFGPFSGIEVTGAGFDFPTGMMANHSKEFPKGRLDKNVLKQFFSIYTRSNGELYWKPGYERIPEDWYRRANNDKYSALTLQEAILHYATETPEAITVGCNVAGVDSYDIIDTGELTNGAYTKEDVAAKPMCLAMEFARQNLLDKLGLDHPLLASASSAVDGVVSELGGCNKVSEFNVKKLRGCPGFSLFGGPTGKIAKGAIQNS